MIKTSRTKAELIRENEELHEKLRLISNEAHSIALNEKFLEYQAFTESSQDHIFSIDKDFRVSIVNRRAAMAFNSEPDKLAGKHIMEIFPPEIAENQISSLKKVISTGIPVTMISESAFPGGKVWLDTSLIPVKNDKGEIISVMGISRDVTLQKNSEIELKKSEEKYRDLYDNAPDMYCSVSPITSAIIECNKTLFEATGYTKEEIIGKPVFEMYDPSMLVEVKEAFDQFSKTGMVRNKELLLKRKDGSTINVSLNVNSVRDKDGIILHSMSAWRDITEQKKAQESLRRSEASMKMILDSLPFGTMIVGRDKRIRSLNESALKLMGYSSFSEVEGKLCHDTMCPAEKCECPILDLSKNIDKSEKILITRESKEIPILKSVIPVTIDNEEVLLESFVDISNLKQLERERELAFEERDRFFKESLGLLCLAGTDGYFKRLNPAWSELLGYTLEELMEKPFLDFIHPEDVDTTLKEVAKLKTGTPTISFLNRYRCKNGTYKWLNWNTSPFGDILYASATDVTKLKETEEKLRTIAEDLRKSNEELEQFAYVASHDLQEPLRMVASFTQLLELRYKDQLDEKANKYIFFAVDGARRMQLLINDLLDFSRISTRGEPFKDISCETVLKKSLDSLKLLAEETKASITHDQLPVIKADMAQLERLFQNLIGNAMKFRKNDSSPVIHISSEELTDRWRFSVKDNGIGIPDEFKEKVFVIFQRLHGKDKYPGTGIGLAVCKRIVNRHGGDIWFDSDPLKGTIFYFTIKK